MNHADNSLNAGNQPAEFWLGIKQFNQGDYYSCHDTLEAIWLDAQILNKGFYQGILQIAVGLYHLTNLNWQGAAILLGEGINRLDAYEDIYGGIDVADLIQQAIDWLTALQETGPNNVQQLASALLAKPLEVDDHTVASKYHLVKPKIQGI
ncbi:DUF309 domain-containing protein [Leptothoe spongobia]|uniref:DUF309 domain-containing protein n=1 Tax=Leptothoe spongobia TAU-MAC 1115 TaxID=1967444 RepID=A0A947GG74_9CYAN|nr:DUF309 domain-containing protein [Leptothoe spongobia]MBT9314199.1 DUF309 domain-containing protein [Leptothoe spongobia TAU-MAC 1115]